MHKSIKKLQLKQLILLLSGLGVLLTLANAFFVTYQAQKAIYIQDTLESNRVYVTKLAETTGLFLNATLRQLEFSGQAIAKQIDNAAFLESEVTRLVRQNKTFNAAIIAKANGAIVSVFPKNVPVLGLVLTDIQSQHILTLRSSAISEPFISPAGNYMVSLSAPIITEQGEYLGFIGGAIYLAGENILNQLLGQHFYQDGSYLYVVEQNGRLIYHQDQSRLGEDVSRNAVVHNLINGKTGAQMVVNTQNVEMLAGYANVPFTQWGLVAQQPKAAALKRLTISLDEIVKQNLPILLSVFLLIYLLGSLIAKPLWAMAKYVEKTDPIGHNEVDQINAWYFEADSLKRAIVESTSMLSNTIAKLDTESMTDPLTGLINRRGLSQWFNSHLAHHQNLVVLACDIDHFKRVNDNYGHPIGDSVLQELAVRLKQQARCNDIVCRAGGEEFLILLPDIQLQEGLAVAERVRLSVVDTAFHTVGRVTISIGVAALQMQEEKDKAIAVMLDNADKALYEAKQAGRNLVRLYQD
ncbi:hypothetical protein PALB_37530 [Pseudoalteromonas luteoviolacea B = ATCC 29581]|nr:hypothetical protein PALB_37530 [Pseudoalteromonas luteoviolacea B = ATCC 29581]